MTKSEVKRGLFEWLLILTLAEHIILVLILLLFVLWHLLAHWIFWELIILGILLDSALKLSCFGPVSVALHLVRHLIHIFIKVSLTLHWVKVWAAGTFGVFLFQFLFGFLFLWFRSKILLKVIKSKILFTIWANSRPFLLIEQPLINTGCLPMWIEIRSSVRGQTLLGLGQQLIDWGLRLIVWGPDQ